MRKRISSTGFNNGTNGANNKGANKHSARVNNIGSTITTSKLFAVISAVLLGLLLIFCSLAQPLSAFAADASSVPFSAISSNLDYVDIAGQIATEHELFQEVNDGDRTSFVYSSFDYSTGTGTKKGEQIAADYIVQRLKSFGYDFATVDGKSNGEINNGGNNNDDNHDNGNPLLSASISAQSNIAANTKAMLSDTSGDADEGTISQIILESFSEVFTEGGYSLFSSKEEYTIWSQNVILRLKNPSTDKRIIIGASIDNDFLAENGTVKSSGAIQSGSGVATLLTLAKMLKGESLPCSVDIVFFGGSRYGGTQYNIGSDYYCKGNSFDDMILMLNLGRLGGETTYVYSDEVQTQLLTHALTLGEFDALPRSLPLLDTAELGGPDSLPYAHYGMVGAHARFMQRGIPVLNFFCGDYSGLSLADSEGSGNILGKDTVSNMLAAYPDAYGKMADTLGAALRLVSDESLSGVVKGSQAARFDYEVFTMRWIAYLIMAGVVLIGFVVFVFVSKSLAAKYPPAKTTSTRVSVFGSDYDSKP